MDFASILSSKMVPKTFQKPTKNDTENLSDFRRWAADPGDLSVHGGTESAQEEAS